MKKVLILIVALLALACVTASAQSDLPPFVQNSIDSCGGKPIAWGTVTYKSQEGIDTWFSFQNSDGYVMILVDNIVPSDIRQNLQTIPSDVSEKDGWETNIDAKKHETLIGTAGYSYLCKDKICTNKKVVKAIQDKTKDTGLTLVVTDYFD